MCLTTKFNGRHDFVVTTPVIFFCFYLKQDRKRHRRLPSVDTMYTQHSGTGCVYGGESQCVSVCVKSPHHAQGSETKNQRYTVNFIPESNPSITAEVAGTPICLVLPRDHISSAMPEIRFDLHGHHHLTVADVRPSPPHSLSVPELPLSPGLQ